MIQNKTVNIEDLTPSQNFVIVKCLELDKGVELTDSGLVTKISQNNSVIDRPTFGTVISVGPDVECYKSNDIVFWDETAGQDIKVKNGDYMILRDTSILGLVK